jgi:hypothetical protein
MLLSSLRSLRSSAFRQAYGATGFAAILDFAFSHLLCVICHLSSVMRSGLAIRAAPWWD